MACTYTYQGKEYTEQEFRDFVANNLVTKKQVRKYDKVWFPKGDTAAKVEGHQTISDFIKTKQSRLDLLNENIELDKRMEVKEESDNSGNYYRIYDPATGATKNGSWLLKEDAQKELDKRVADNFKEWNREKEQVEKELKQAKEGTLKISAIHSFYENNISNILKKFGATTEITDEYGNTWTEVDLSDEKIIQQVSPIVLNQTGNNVYYQTPAGKETLDKITQLLSNLGVRVEYVDDLIKEFGALALVDLSENLIKMTAGAEGVSLTEEAMHIISRMIPESMYADLLDQITSYKIYNQTLQQYGGLSLYQNPDGTVNLDKIKLEAIGKLLAEYYIMNSENLSKDQVNVAKTLWDRITDWILNVFGLHQDAFQDLINKLETGELTLDNAPLRSEILLQAAFTRDNLNRVRDTLNEDVNEQVIEALRTSIQRINSEDLPLIYNNLSKISGVDKGIFGYGTSKVKDSLDPKQIKNQLENMIGYIGSINNTTASLRHEIEGMVAQLNNPEGLTPYQIDKLHSNIYYINQIAQIYREELSEINQIFTEAIDDNQAIRDLRDILISSTGNITEIEDTFKSTSKKQAAAVFNQAINTKVRNSQAVKKKERDILQIRYAKHPSKRLADKIKVLEDELANPLTGEDIVKMLEQPAFSGLWGWWHKYADGILTNKEQDIQTIANTIYSKILESRAAAEPDLDEIAAIGNEYIRRRGNRPVDLDTYYNPLLEGVVHRYEFVKNLNPKDDEPTGTLREWNEIRLLSAYNQYEYENNIALAQYRISTLEDEISALESLIGEATDPAIIKDLNDKLTQANKDLTTAEQDLESLGKLAQDRYTPEYYEIQKELLVTLSDGKTTVKDVRDAIIKELKDLEEQIVYGIPDYLLESILDERTEQILKLQRLEREVNLDGTDKTGDDLLVAQTLTKWKALKRENDLDTSFISNVSQARWDEQRSQVDEKLEVAKANFAARATPANKIALDAAEKAHEVWYRANSRTTLPELYYEDRNALLGAISDILEPYLADPAIEDKYKEATDEIWAKIHNLTKGIRDEDNVLNGTLALNISERIRDLELTLRELKEDIMEKRIKLSHTDFINVAKLYAELEEVQDTPLTKYWHQQIEPIKSSLRATITADPANTGKTPKQIEILVNKAFSETDFFKQNTIEVTSSFRQVDAVKLPSNVFRINRRDYKPIYTWRETVPVSDEYQKIEEPSMRWKTYRVNPKFINENYETIQGKVALDPAKSSTYENKKYTNLSPDDKATLEGLRSVYYRNQMNKGASNREGDAIPRIQSKGLQKWMQRVRHVKSLHWKQLFTKQLWKDVFGINPTLLEMEYGEGMSEDRDDASVRVMAKFTNKNLNVNRQDKDLLKVLTLYTIESHKYSKMWDLVPILSTVRGVLAKKKDNKQEKDYLKHKREVVDYAIEKLVNAKSRKASTMTGRAIRNLQGLTQSSLAFLRLGLPWMQTQVLKNQLQGMWQIMLMSSWFSQYSKANLVYAMGRAAKKSFKLVYQGPLGRKVDKYTAIVRHLRVVPSYDIYDRANTFNSTFTKDIDNARYLLGIERQYSELQLTLTMYEMFKAGYKRFGDGKTLEDMYDYVDGKLTSKLKPSVKPDGTPLLKQSVDENGDLMFDDKGDPIMEQVYEPIMSKEIEQEITTSVNNMFQFTQGNYDYANGVLAKAYWLGSALLFMKNFLYNNSVALFGSKRNLSSGHDIEGSYRIFAKLFSESAWNVVGRGDLTPNERAGLIRFYLHTVVINAIGAGLYAAGAALSGSDDDDEQISWYVLNLVRKTYSELAYFSAVDKAAVAGDILFGDRKIATAAGDISNPIGKAFMFSVGNPAIDIAAGSILPFDWKSLKFSNDIKTTDPYFERFKDDGLRYDLAKLFKTKSEMTYPKSSLHSFLYYDESIFDYEKGDDEKKSSSSGTSRRRRRRVAKPKRRTRKRPNQY